MRQQLQRLFDAISRGHRFVTHDIWFLGREGEGVPYGFVVKQIRVLIVLLQNMVQDALLLRAAALAYTTVLSLVPFVAVVYFVISQFNLTTEITTLIAGIVGVEPSPQRDAGRIGEPEDPNEQIKGMLELLVPGLSATMEPEPEKPDEKSQEEPASDTDVEPEAPDENSSEHPLFGPSGPGAMFDSTADDEETSPAPLAEEPAPSDTAEEGKAAFPESYEDPVDLILRMASKSADPKTLGVMGLIFVLTAVFGLMRNIESSFNSIWGLKSTRSWYRMFSDYMMITLLLPFVVMGVIGLTAALSSDIINDRLGYLAYGVRGIQYLVIWFAFSALYAIVPNTKVKWRYAVLGAFVAGTLWLLLSMGYFGLQYGLARNSVVYSSFALFPFMLIWIYFSWVILLFGAELTFAYQNEKTFAMERHAAGASQAYREAVALRVMVETAHRFDAGMPGLAPSEAAEEWKVPMRLLNETLEQLDEAGLVQRSATEPVRFSPARSIDKITIGHVIAALRESGREPSALREEELLKPLLREVSGQDSKLMWEPLSDVVHRLHPPRPALTVDEDHETRALPDGTSPDDDT